MAMTEAALERESITREATTESLPAAVNRSGKKTVGFPSRNEPAIVTGSSESIVPRYRTGSLTSSPTIP